MDRVGAVLRTHAGSWRRAVLDLGWEHRWERGGTPLVPLYFAGECAGAQSLGPGEPTSLHTKFGMGKKKKLKKVKEEPEEEL